MQKHWTWLDHPAGKTFKLSDSKVHVFSHNAVFYLQVDMAYRKKLSMFKNKPKVVQKTIM